MSRNIRRVAVAALAAMALFAIDTDRPRLAFAQDQQTVATADEQAPTPLTEDEFEVLVARIALYPDELVAVISASALYPLQIVEAARFLDQVKKNSALKPKSTWDGSVISLLNYPEIVRMMSDNLDWTQALGEALSYQQKDVLLAIQQLRAKAVADGIIIIGKYVMLGLVHDGGELGHLGADLIGNGAPLLAGGLWGLLSEGGGDEGRYDAPPLPAGMGQNVPHEVHPAPVE
jgi:hypothetical protein